MQAPAHVSCLNVEEAFWRRGGAFAPLVAPGNLSECVACMWWDALFPFYVTQTVLMGVNIALLAASLHQLTLAAARRDCQRTTHVLRTHSLLGHLASCCYGCRAIPVLVVQVTRRCSLNTSAAGLSLLCKRRSGGKRCAGSSQLASHISHSKLRCICAELLGYYITSGPHHHLIMLVPHIPKSHPTLSRW